MDQDLKSIKIILNIMDFGKKDKDLVQVHYNLKNILMKVNGNKIRKMDQVDQNFKLIIITKVNFLIMNLLDLDSINYKIKIRYLFLLQILKNDYVVIKNN